MSKTHVIDGVAYVEVGRSAESGDFVLCKTGNIRKVNKSYADGDVILADNRGFCSRDFYVVLEPLEEPTVDGTQASPEVIDMLANLARRVTQLESQLAATQRNLETFAEQTESIKYLAESNEQDIAMLDERTFVLNAINKYYAEGSR